MNKNLPVIFLTGLAIIFIIFLVYTLFKNKKRGGEGYGTPEYRMTNGEFINRILNSRLSLQEMLEAIQPFRNSPYWNSYRDLKDIIETLKSPNLERFRDEFIRDAFNTLNKIDWQNRPKFPPEVRNYIFELITRAELANQQPQQPFIGWPLPIPGNDIDDDDDIAIQPPPAIILPINFQPAWGNDEGEEDLAPLDDEDDDFGNAPTPPFNTFVVNNDVIPQPFWPPQNNNLLNILMNNNLDQDVMN